MSVARLFRESLEIPEDDDVASGLASLLVCAELAGSVEGVGAADAFGAGVMLILVRNSAGDGAFSSPFASAEAPTEGAAWSGADGGSDEVGGGVVVAAAAAPSFATRLRRICSMVSLSGASGGAGCGC